MEESSVERDLLRKLILEDYLFTDDQFALSDSTSFLDEGILDSMGILEIIMFLEDQFQIKVDDDEMVPENLDSIENLLAFMSRKKKAS